MSRVTKRAHDRALIIANFVDKARATYGDLITSIMLFGSVARGESSPLKARCHGEEPNLSQARAQAGKSNASHLYLGEKDPTMWERVEGGAWGKMTYNLAGPMFEFVFNGKGLEAGYNFTLIYYPDPWPGAGLICLGSV